MHSGETPPPYLEAIPDPLESDGCVPVPQEPGMGYRIRWDYIEALIVCRKTHDAGRCPADGSLTS